MGILLTSVLSALLSDAYCSFTCGFREEMDLRAACQANYRARKRKKGKGRGGEGKELQFVEVWYEIGPVSGIGG